MQDLIEEFLETLKSQNSKSSNGSDLKSFCAGKTLSEVVSDIYTTNFMSKAENSVWRRKLYSLRSFFTYLSKIGKIESTPPLLDSFNGYEKFRKKGLIVNQNLAFHSGLQRD